MAVPGWDTSATLTIRSEDDNQLSQEFFVSPTSSFLIGSSVFAQRQRISCAHPPCMWRDIEELQGNSSFETCPNVPVLQSEQDDCVNLQLVQTNGLNENTLQSSTVRPSKRPAQPKSSEVRDTGKLLDDQSVRGAKNTGQSQFNEEKAECQDDDGEDGETCCKQGNSLTIRQEKNRLAAAKCRQKQKAGNQQKEEACLQETAWNKFLDRELRELRNVKVRLQNALLAHLPGVCDCHDIHQYNFEQAQRLVLDAQRQPVQPAPLPSQESTSWIQYPETDASFAGTFSGSSQAPPSRRMSMPSRPPPP